ncbi:MAG: hypothetical protein JJU32_16405 [Phormidium sp. BM_Day4_Bin.17]|nr:hypothetical protein [Phormidium sp. BM_Day4_Bin.17]UCJ11166.1 MAG: hypothetical protein JWS08_15420 [Phormidium sp. PBR-2020]
MKLKLTAKVDGNGKLSLQLPSELANHEVDIILCDHNPHPTPEELGYPADFFEKTAGQWQGEPPTREDVKDCDLRLWDS